MRIRIYCTVLYTIWKIFPARAGKRVAPMVSTRANPELYGSQKKKNKKSKKPTQVFYFFLACFLLLLL